MKRRRAILVFIVGTIAIVLLAGAMPRLITESLPEVSSNTPTKDVAQSSLAIDTLEQLEVKGRAPKTNYSREQFGGGWDTIQGCSVRNVILYRDLQEVQLNDECIVASGRLNDPYSGDEILFTRENSSEVQIDHVVALSDAWQKGAQQLTNERREQLANDPLELLAVSGRENQAKSDGDAATWLPSNKSFRCEYVARQIAVKIKYQLWVTSAEKEAIQLVLKTCPGQKIP